MDSIVLYKVNQHLLWLKPDADTDDYNKSDVDFIPMELITGLDNYRPYNTKQLPAVLHNYLAPNSSYLFIETENFFFITYYILKSSPKYNLLASAEFAI